MKNYIQNLRKKIGHDKFIHPAARIIVENEHGDILFIERKDTGHLGIPAGALEEGENIETCIVREVKEETGLDLLVVEVIGISSHPAHESVQYPNGDQIQYFTVEFYSNQWTGTLGNFDENEVRAARFMDKKHVEDLPHNEKATFSSWAFYKKNKTIHLR